MYIIQVQRLSSSSFQEYFGTPASLVTLIDGILYLLKFVRAPCAHMSQRSLEVTIMPCCPC